MSRPIIIANCSGFFGDRLSAAREMVDGGPIDVLTGDWLAELTMLILARQRMKHGPGAGYARTFLAQMEQVLGACRDKGIRVVSNAGGLDPQGCADALSEIIERLDIGPVSVAVVTGDDLMPRMGELDEEWRNLDTRELPDGVHFITANAYLGGEPITAALSAGADVVITGRVTDAALVVGPAAWWHGWSYADAAAGDPSALDRFAGAIVAGHAIECGAQVTGGNYSFFQGLDLLHPGFPIAEVAADGSSIITKHPGTGGVVTVGTVTAQLLYEIGSRAYANPDATARFDTIQLAQDGDDRVRISGVRGESAPERLKVAANYLGGFRNSMTLVMTGLDPDAKADLALRTITGLSLAEALEPGLSASTRAARSSLSVRELDIDWSPTSYIDPATADQAQSFLRITARDGDPKAVAKPFTTAVIEATLASYPGMFPTAPPGEGTPYGVYWPATVDRATVPASVTVDGQTVPITTYLRGETSVLVDAPAVALPEVRESSVLGVPLGVIAGARSGDKGGDANIGVWIPAAMPLRDEVYAWLVSLLTPDRIRELLPEAALLAIDVHPLPNLHAVNIVIHGLLGRGVAENARSDPQAKGLGEHLRSRIVPIPRHLLPDAEVDLA
ncbi:MAG: acyclic terpene utilization AtuA family protein [Actinomycetota bacterium]